MSKKRKATHSGDRVLTGVKPEDGDLLRRFAEKYEVSEDGCWLWTGATIRGGYGQMKAWGRHETAHRIAYRLFVGPIPKGLEMEHLCRVRNCVNPEHVEPVTHAENMARSSKGRDQNPNCPNGHPYVNGSWVWRSQKNRPTPWRTCLICEKAGNRRKYAKTKSKIWAGRLVEMFG